MSMLKGTYYIEWSFSTSTRYNTWCYANPNSGINRNNKKKKRQEKSKILGHYLISNAFMVPERSVEKKQSGQFWWHESGLCKSDVRWYQNITDEEFATATTIDKTKGEIRDNDERIWGTYSESWHREHSN